MVTLTENKIIIEIETQYPHHSLENLKKGLVELLQNNWILTAHDPELVVAMYGFAVFELMEALVVNEQQLRTLFRIE